MISSDFSAAKSFSHRETCSPAAVGSLSVAAVCRFVVGANCLPGCQTRLALVGVVNCGVNLSLVLGRIAEGVECLRVECAAEQVREGVLERA